MKPNVSSFSYLRFFPTSNLEEEGPVVIFKSLFFILARPTPRTTSSDRTPRNRHRALYTDRATAEQIHRPIRQALRTTIKKKAGGHLVRRAVVTTT